jgi:hypothetical protein
MRHGILCTRGDQGLTEPSRIGIGNCDAYHSRSEMESEKARVIPRFSRKEAYSRYFGICDRRLDLSSSRGKRLATTTVGLLCRLGYLRNQ